MLDELESAIWELNNAAEASYVAAREAGLSNGNLTASVRIEFPAAAGAAADQLFAALAASPRPGWLSRIRASAVISSLGRGNLQPRLAAAAGGSLVVFETRLPFSLASFGERADAYRAAVVRLAGGEPQGGAGGQRLRVGAA